jgi:hypothetical protein
LGSPIFKKPRLFHFAIWCLLKATHRPYSGLVGYQKIDLQPGQFIFGRRAAAKELPLSEQNIRTCLKTLRELGFLTIKSTHRFSVITIVNWDSYQDRNNKANPVPTQCQPSANHVQAHRAYKTQREGTTLPADFTLNTDTRKRATAAGLSPSDVERVFNKFKAHYRSKGTVSRSWPDEWEKWCHREAEYWRTHSTTGNGAELSGAIPETKSDLQRKRLEQGRGFLLGTDPETFIRFAVKSKYPDEEIKMVLGVNLSGLSKDEFTTIVEQARGSNDS